MHCFIVSAEEPEHPPIMDQESKGMSVVNVRDSVPYPFSPKKGDSGGQEKTTFQISTLRPHAAIRPEENHVSGDNSFDTLAGKNHFHNLSS